MDMSHDNINRRRVLAGLGAAGVGSLAGCNSNNGNSGNGGNGGGSSNLGERVPTINFQYWTGLGAFTADQENMLPTIKQNWESLGLTIKTNGLTYPSMLSWMTQDKHQSVLPFFGHGPTPSRLDPEELMKRFGIQRAGANGIDNPPEYANCAVTDLAFKQATAASTDQRKQLVQKALKKRTADYWCIATCTKPVFGGIRTDKIEPNGIGNFGVTVYNMNVPIKSRLKSGDTMTYGLLSGTLASKDYYTRPGTTSLAFWQHLVNTCLLEYDENFNLVNALAKSVTQENGGKKVTVKLRDGKFSNGDPITAEDVKFTFEFIQGNPGAFPKANSPAYNDIKVVDDKTVVFTGDTPFPSLLTKTFTLWGILHKKSWVDSGAADNPGKKAPDTIISSGPYQVTNFKPEQAIALKPNKGHALRGVKDGWSPDHKILGQVFDKEESGYQSFKQGQIDIQASVSSGTFDRMNKLSNVKAVATPTFLNYPIYPQNDVAPTKFKEFRQAAGMVIDRKKLNAVAFSGQTKPAMYPEVLAESHPFRSNEGLTKFTDKESGDLSGAKQVMKDAGWGWDNDGNLHYPPDADLSPTWPEGEVPQPGDFPCMKKVNGQVRYIKPNGQPYNP